MLHVTRRRKPVNPAPQPAPVVFLHARVQYRSAFCSRGVFGLAELGDDRMVELRPLGADASAGFIVKDCATGETVEVECDGTHFYCSCRAAQTRLNFGGSSHCVHATGIATLAARGDL